MLGCLFVAARLRSPRVQLPARPYAVSIEHNATIIADLEAPGSSDEANRPMDRSRLLLYQYERCGDDWRHHDAIIWEIRWPP